MSLKKCQVCGYRINEERKQCPNCGNRNFKVVINQNEGLESEEKVEYITYENNIAMKLDNWGKSLFIVLIIIGIILLIVFFTSLDNVTKEYEKVPIYFNLYLSILSFCAAFIEKLLISAKAEQIELLYQIKKNTDKKDGNYENK